MHYNISMIHYDLCIIGGGVNGAGIARDAAGRGLKVLLLESGDLAGATSSASTKLIHGGLRYLEYYEFKLVREALGERQTMLNIAPHLIRPLTFVLPHESHLRPAWMIRMGLFLYDHLASHGKLPGSHSIGLTDHAYGSMLQDRYTEGFTYSDCWVDDARLVVLNALDAHERGATILTRTRCTSLRTGPEGWIIDYEGYGGNRTVTAKAVINAAGPWVRQVLDDNYLALPETPKVRLVKGSHIVTLKLFEGEQAYILQQPDRRIVFAIPYQKNFTLIGTTDEEYKGDPRDVAISSEETDYLCNAINRTFKTAIRPADVVWNYSGVRPLLDDGSGNASAVTRDYKLILENHDDSPILSVFGGKITTYRHLAEEAINSMAHRMGWTGKAWTKTTPLPGGDLPGGDFETFATQQARRYPWLPDHMLHRFAHAYGTRMDQVIGTAEHIGDLGHHYGGCIYDAELRYLIEHEWAMTAEDVLWRRTKLGLHCNPEAVMAVEQAFMSLSKGQT